MASRKQYPTCPACRLPRDRTEMAAALAALNAYERRQYRYYDELGLAKYQLGVFVGNKFEWACDVCLDARKAVPANPGRQNASAYPHLAYADQTLTCRDCGTDFCFTKADKQRWYEQYQLPTEAQPVRCPACQTRVRAARAENRRLSNLLRRPLAGLTPADLREVVTIHRNNGREQKAKYFEAHLRKRET